MLIKIEYTVILKICRSQFHNITWLEFLFNEDTFFKICLVIFPFFT